MRVRYFLILVTLLLPLGLLACSADQGAVSTVEREQILNVVREMYYQQPGAPQNEFTIDKVEGDWVRVRMVPLGTDAKPEFVYLHRTKSLATPAAAPSLAPIPGATSGLGQGQTPPPPFNQNPPPLFGNTPPLVTTSGWAVILGPQTNFTPGELASFGIPADMIPGD